MTTVFLIPPGTRVAVSDGGSDFTVRVLKRQLQFSVVPELTETQAIFVDGKRRVSVDRASVVVARFDGTGGANQFGV